jgi:TetR/AcrR family transcriptional repressor of nem operon
LSNTADRLVQEARQLIIHGGYNGFSYADLAERFGIRKASIHHHFPSKVDLVVAVIEQERAGLRAQIDALEATTPGAIDQLLAYLDYWKRCIADQPAAFCLAGVLAVELPGLPPQIGPAVRGFFTDLHNWLERLLALGVEQGTLQLENPPDVAAEFFQSAVYGAMLIARAHDDPARFAVVVDAFFRRMRRDVRH